LCGEWGAFVLFEDNRRESMEYLWALLCAERDESAWVSSLWEGDGSMLTSSVREYTEEQSNGKWFAFSEPQLLEVPASMKEAAVS
jgi:hypothetical protein